MTQNFQVRLSMNQAAVVKSGLVLKQGDFGMNLEIEVLNFDTSNTTPQIVFRKPMGAVESTSVTKSGNVYTYTFKGTELDTPGKVICDLKLKNSTTQRISTASFSFEVVADTLDGLAEEASSYSDTIEQLLADVVHLSDTPGLVKNDGSIDTEIIGKTDQLVLDNQAAKRNINEISDATGSGEAQIIAVWEVGAIEAGTDIPTSKRLRTKNYLKTYKNTTIYTDSEWLYIVYYYNDDFSYTGANSSNWRYGSYIVDLSYPYYRVMLRNTNSSMDMVVSYGDNLSTKWETDILKKINSTNEIANTGKETIPFKWVVGTISGGSDATSGKRLRTDGFYKIKDNTILEVDTNWFVEIWYYLENKTYSNVYDSWNNGTIKIKTNYSYFRLVLRNINSSMDMVISYGSHVKGFYFSDQLINESKRENYPPDYLMEAVDSAITNINTEYNSPALIFGWITDSHLNPANNNNVRVWKNTLKALKAIVTNSPIRFILHTGDYVDLNYARDGATNTEVFNALSKSIRGMFEIDNRLLICNGNHDGVGANGYGNIQWYYAGNGSINNEYAKKNGVANSYSYKDFDDLKIRVLTLSLPDSNTSSTYYWGFSHEQIQWILNEALDVEDGWGIIITIHAPTTNYNNGSRYGHVDIIEGIFTAFNNHSTFTGTYSDGTREHTVNVDYSNFENVKVIACFAGHTHGDLIIQAGATAPNGETNGLPCPIIVSAAAWFDATGETGYTCPTREYYTENEVLFNVVCYYPTLEEIKIYRVGAGNDMEVDLSE